MIVTDDNNNTFHEAVGTILPPERVLSFNGRAGIVVLTADDVTEALGFDPSEGSDVDLSNYVTTSSLTIALAAKQPIGSYANAAHTHIIADVTGLQTALDSKAASSHTHIIGDVTGLQGALDAKQVAGSYAPLSHSHIIADVTGLQGALDGKQPLDADLTAIATLAGTTGLLKKTAADTWALDTTAYTTNLGTVTGVTGTAPIVSSGGSAPAISITAATTAAAGSMSAADKTKLDAILGTNSGDETYTTITTKLAGGSGGGTTKFLRADGTFAAPPAGGTTSFASLTGVPADNASLTTALNTKVNLTGGNAITGTQAITGELTVGADANYRARLLSYQGKIYYQGGHINGAGNPQDTVFSGYNGVVASSIEFSSQISKFTDFNSITRLQVDVNGAAVTGALTVSGALSGSNFSGSSSGTNTGDQTSVSGNAGTATKLLTARTINGVAFDGSANITINAVDSTARLASSAVSTFMLTVLDDIDAATARATLGLGTAATSAATAFQPAGTYVTAVTGTAPIVSSGGTAPAISITAATAAAAGSMSAADKAKLDNFFADTNGNVGIGGVGTDYGTAARVLTLHAPAAGTAQMNYLVGGVDKGYTFATSGGDFIIQPAGGSIKINASGGTLVATFASTGLTLAGAIAATGAVTSSGTAGIGYATGAGGAVTQATSRTTGVTLNKPSGAITLFSTTTTANLVTTFTVTNSTVAIGDTVNVSVRTATGIYLAFVTKVAAGSFNISVFTPTAVAVAEAPIINFAVVKAVSA